MQGEDQTSSPDDTAIRLQRGVDYIERSIAERISLADVAAEAALSDHHFHRLFRARYGVPVMDYVRRRRLTQAAERLVRGSDAIIEIALDAGFASQAAFTRAFRRVFYVTPAAYRATGRNVPWLSASTLSEETLATLPELRSGSPRLEAIEGFRVAGLQAAFTGEGRADIPALWDKLVGLFDADAFRSADRFGISLPTFDALHGTFDYLAAVVLDDDEPTASVLTIAEIPAGSYVVFTFSGAPARLPAALDYIFGVWMPASDHILRGAPSFERYPKGFVLGETVELELWFPVE
jgi:AraC family transcriptional regulator